MADKVGTENTPTQGMALAIDNLIAYFQNQRKGFERRWYDNNFFDDGFHFRYLSRTTGKIIDINDKSNLTMPSRAIPKASRQIRGVANLLLLPEYVPVVYPEKVSASQFPPLPAQQPQAPQMGQEGQTMPSGMPANGPQTPPGMGQATPMPPQAQQNPEYVQAMKIAKEVAKKTGHWLTKEWEKQDLEEKLTLMVILAAKHSVSFLQCWPDAVDEKINTQVYDAFDIYLKGNLNDMYDSPAVIKCIPMLISEIKADERLGLQDKAVQADNKYAQSSVKDAYSRSRFGQGMESDMANTAILKEAYIKEYLNDQNREQVAEALGEKFSKYKDGDMVIRQTFSAGGQVGTDTYLDIPEYPFIDFRMEPGPIYSVPLIERFIPANKSLDIVMSRLERYFNTMVAGSWLVRKGENMQITNIPGGQQIEYTTTPPTQAAMQNPQSAIFPYIQMLDKIIEEQGASTSALGQLPTGVKSGVAIESVKQTEYSNLKIPAQQLKRTVKLISERLLDYASKFIQPQTVYLLDKDEPTYFDIVGEEGYKAHQKIGAELPQDTVVLKKDYHVEIQVEQGAGFTVEGQRESMEKVIQFFAPLVQAQLVPPEAIKQIAQQVLDTYGFGATQEFMDAMDQGALQVPENQIMQMKVAIAEVLKDAQMGGKEAEQRQVMASKVGTLEALKESGMADKILGKNGQASKISESMSYKDAPPSIQRQMEAQAGFEPATQQEHAIQQVAKVSSLIPKGGQNTTSQGKGTSNNQQ